MNSWMEYWKKIWKVPALIAFCAVLMAIVFLLYDLPAEPVIYGAVLCIIAGSASFFYGHTHYVKKKQSLEYVKGNILINLEELPQPEDELEDLYQEMIRELNAQRMKAETGKQKFYTELTDYYTMWVHQIKTPIAAMRLLLQEDMEKNKEALSELFKVEQYVEMVLGYLRTEDMASDIKFREVALDSVIREQIHKYARIFIGKKLALEYSGVDETVLTDSKWLGFVIGQLLSNALKYTKSGKISVYMSESRPHTLVIEDTGIGISKADLPRIFEKGFTGNNGREESRSTGIGLYLSAKIMKKLGHGISVESGQNEGTRVYLALGRKKLDLY
ncbi:MAG: sensor histidine kinase [Eubacteriales bacterium]|nr:sensor histidine kinase [Eubacteriales bacterium]